MLYNTILLKFIKLRQIPFPEYNKIYKTIISTYTI